MLSVVIPCFDETENVRRFPAELYPHLPEGSEVILVDDGSRRPLEAPPPARVVRHETNQGLGAALRTGFAEAKGEWILTLDADLTFSPRDIAKLLAKRDADLVGGSPWLPGGGFEGVPLSRKLPSALINAFFRGFITPAISSYTSIFRLYRAETLRALKLTSRGYEINAELAARFARARRKVAEVPVVLSTRRHGHSKLSGARELRNHAALVWRLMREPR